MVTHDNQVEISTLSALDSYSIDLMLEELKIWGELYILESGPHVCFSGIIFTTKRLTQTKFSRQ